MLISVTQDDSDADGLIDEWEVTNFGSVSAVTGVEDTDGDGYTNAKEYVAGTNPNDAASKPSLPDLIWTGAAGDGDFFNEGNWDSDAVSAGTQAPVAGSLDMSLTIKAASLTLNNASFVDMMGAIVPDGASMTLSGCMLDCGGLLRVLL